MANKLLRGIDDALANEAINKWHGPGEKITDIAKGTCARCHISTYVHGDGRCTNCQKELRELATSRAICDFIHRPWRS